MLRNLLNGTAVMTIDQISTFIMLATTLNYTQTAEILHVTQPTVSKTIKTLEGELGFSLFLRDTKSVTLTPAGKVFLEEAGALNNQFVNLSAAAKDIKRGLIGHINIGYVGYSMAEHLSAIIQGFKTRNPSIAIRMIDYTSSDITEALIDDEIDVALSDLYNVANLRDVQSFPIFTATYHIAMNENHSLAQKASLTIDDIKNEPFVMQKSSHSSDISKANRYHPLMRLSAEEGFVPEASQYASTIINLLFLVDAGFGLAFLATHLKYVAPRTVKFIPLAGVRPHIFTGALSWKRTNSNPSVCRFIESVKETTNIKIQEIGRE